MRLDPMVLRYLRNSYESYVFFFKRQNYDLIPR